jgi:hypothetical protein
VEDCWFANHLDDIDTDCFDHELLSESERLMDSTLKETQENYDLCICLNGSALL